VLQAQTVIWDGGGGDTNWATVNNWNPDGLPSSTASLVFGTVGWDQSISLGANRSASSLTFNSTNAYSFSGYQLSLTGTGTNLTISSSGSATISSNLVLSNGLQIGGAGTGAVTLSGAISGTGGLTKSTAGTLTLSGNNTYSGATTISSGLLNIGSSTAIASGSNLSIASGATVDALGNAITIGTLSGSGTLKIASLTVGNSSNSTFSGVLADGYYGNLTKVGTGTLTLSGNSTFSGKTTISQGALEVQSATALGGSTWGNVVASGAALRLAGGITLAEGSFSLSGSGTDGQGALRSVSGTNTFSGALNFDAATTIGADAGAVLQVTGDLNLSYQLTSLGAGNTMLSGAVNGSMGIVKSGSGTLTFTGTTANNFSGALAINEGLVVFAKSANTVNNRGEIIIGDGSGSTDSAILRLDADGQLNADKTITINSDGFLNLNNYDQTVKNLSLNGGTIATGTGTLTLNGGVLSTNAAATTMTISGNLALGGYTNTINTADGSAAIDLNLNAILSGTGGLTKEGAGTLLLSGSGNYTGNTIINTGILRLGVDNALASTSPVSVASGATLDLAGFNASVSCFSGAGNIVLGSGTLTTISTAANYGTYSGVISGTGNLVKNDAGTLILSGSNTYTGSTTAGAGILRMGATNALPTATALSVASGATFDLRNYATSVGSLTGSGSVTLGSGTLSVGSSNASSTFAGVISGTGGVTKTGTGTFTLSGANTYSGATTLSAGSLQISADSNLGSSSLVFNGGTLATSASITTSRAASVQSGGGTISTASGTTYSMTGVISGAGGLTKTGDGTLVLSGTNTYSGGTTVSGGLLQIGSTANLGSAGTSNLSVASGAVLEKVGAGSLVFNSTINIAGELRLSGGTLAINGVTVSLGTLHITGNTTIDFGSGSSTLDVSSLIIDAGVTVSIINWINAGDYFFAQSWSGAQVDIRGTTPMNQVTFSGYSANQTAWTSLGQITPVPEPHVYGVGLMVGSLGFYLVARRKANRAKVLSANQPRNRC
jgi:autotransporter-associated beta strand protein